jgi:hypothetical protein
MKRTWLLTVLVLTLAAAAVYGAPPEGAGFSKIGVATGIVYDSAPGTVEAPITASRGNFQDRKNRKLIDDIAGQSGAALRFYSDPAFSSELPGTATYSISSETPEYSVYVKVTAGKTVVYYIVKIRHNSLNPPKG